MHLSFDAELALLYSAAALFRAGRVNVPASGIVRAALVAYAARLDEADAMQAFAEARSACGARVVDADDRQMAELRLLSVPADEPLPPFGAVLRGHDSAARAARLDARVEAITGAVLGAAS